MGASKFQGTCASYGEDIPIDLAQLAVDTFRKTHRQVVSLWYDLERACKNAINNPGSKHTVGKLGVFTLATAGRRFLMIKLPSKRHIAFPEPAVEADQITFYGQIPMKQIWGRISTYGGRLVENVTQAVAADVMTMGTANAIKAGHKVVMLVHDEAVRLTRGSQHDLDHFVKCLLDMPEWASGLPLDAEGATIPFYKK
jgi:DNA polymerase